MNDEELKEKIKGIVDNPGDAIEKSVKKGLETVMKLGKEVTDKIKEKEKRKGGYDEHQSTLMMSEKGMK